MSTTPENKSTRPSTIRAAGNLLGTTNQAKGPGTVSGALVLCCSINHSASPTASRETGRRNLKIGRRGAEGEGFGAV